MSFAPKCDAADRRAASAQYRSMRRRRVPNNPAPRNRPRRCDDVTSGARAPHSRRRPAMAALAVLMMTAAGLFIKRAGMGGGGSDRNPHQRRDAAEQQRKNWRHYSLRQNGAPATNCREDPRLMPVVGGCSGGSASKVTSSGRRCGGESCRPGAIYDYHLQQFTPEFREIGNACGWHHRLWR